VFGHVVLHELPQVGLLVAFDDVGRGDVTKDAVDAAIAGHMRFATGEQSHQVGFSVGLVQALEVVIPVEFGLFQQRVGVNL